MADTKEKQPKQEKKEKKEKKGKKAAPEAPAQEAPSGEPAPRPRLLDYYEQRVRGKLQQQFGYKNPHQIPKLVKIVLNVGIGDASKNPKTLEAAVAELGSITGQQPVVTKAKKAIANFNLRAGVPIGCAVTLRGARMFEFLDRFINVAVPRMRDFRGLPDKSFDGRGNYTLGVKEQMIFPEIDYDKVEKIHGMDITFVTTAGRDDAALALLREMGMPFRGEPPVVAA
ncbi:MAG TPA: 50S ribosomal protein L5 [Gemmatimonadales bacterium]|jgi:large subunit ribosomal protein L5|nr:50S ribosomal protein L5 [Gemmatimonadales bacterium]